MIYSLEIENFYSILESQAIDLRAAENAPWGQHLVTLWPGATERAPRVIALFGANGSGKSTVLRALAFLAWFARDSFLAEPEGWLPYAPFADSAASNLPTRLALHFSGPQEPDRITEFAPRGCRYRYEVALHSEDGRAPRVISESLHYWPRDDGRQVRLFERRGDRDEIAAGKALDFSRYRLASEKILRPNASLISTLAQLQHPFALALRRAASSICSNIFIEKHEPSDEIMLRQYSAAPNLIEQLNKEIERIDLGVRSMRIEQGPTGPLALFQHQGLTNPLPMQLESHGTRMFVRSFPLLMQALEVGGVAVVDELDCAIHPLLLPEILRWFRDSERNPHNAQLWMSCQNASLLEDLEKEEVLFTEKGPTGRTNVYGLADVKGVRRLDNLYRKYLSGTYGAIPRVG
jgi:predicted ATPase